MDDKGSLVVRRRDDSDIVKLEEPRILEEFLDEHLTFIAETMTGALGQKSGCGLISAR